MTDETTSAADLAAPAATAETTPTTAPATEETTQESTAPAADTTPPDKDAGGFVFPKAEDAEAVLSFRKQCGYPDEVGGYGLPMETDEQKDVLNFIHKCKLDPIAAKEVVDNLAVEIAEQAKQAKAKYEADYAKVTADWGDSKKGNESLVSKGCEALNVSDDQLRGISDVIGVEAALGIMLAVGKLKSDYSGVGGGSGGDSESIEDFISSKRRR